MNSQIMTIENEQIRGYTFLRGMISDTYFPPALVAKGQLILVSLCKTIEEKKPGSTEDLYVFTHAATEEFNNLAYEFENAGSEIETAAREIIAEDFDFIANAYGFDADTEDLIATRDW
jgi:Family of unknown function (DUF5713)